LIRTVTSYLEARLDPYIEPDGMALRLDKDTDLILNTHLQTSGKPETIQPTLGLYFTDKPPPTPDSPATGK